MRLFGGNIQSMAESKEHCMRLAILVKAVVLSGAIAKLKQNIPILIDSLLEQSTFNSNLLRKLSSLTYILTSSNFCSSCAAEIILPLSQTGKKIKFCRKKEVLNTRHLYILVYLRPQAALLKFSLKYS